MNFETIKADLVNVGDTLILADNTPVKIKSITKGMIFGTFHFAWNKGWCSVGKISLVDRSI